MVQMGRGRRSSNVDDRRSQGPVYAAGGGAAAGVLGLLLRILPSLLRNKAFRNLFLIAIVAFGVAWFVFPKQTQALLASLVSGQMPATGGAEQSSSPEDDAMAAFASGILSTTEEVWSEIFSAQGKDYPEPILVLYRGGTRTGCGVGQAAMGPFYCPAPDPALNKPAVYIDLSFFEEMERKMNAAGDFAQAYVIAHEVGHHVQNITGVLDWSMREKQRLGANTAGANQVQVRVELMADCYAGVWANRAEKLSDFRLEPGDLEEAVAAAEAVGDDTLQRKAQGRIVPDAFTHGSAKQRVRWFMAGFETGNPASCDTRSLPYDRL
jgi:uncharacterized protein